MMMRFQTTLLVAAVLCAAGCQKNYIRPPAGKTVELAGLKADWHDFASKLCETDPRVVSNELTAMNAVLLKYLDATSAGTDGVWADEHVQILEQGKKQLPEALNAYEQTVKGTARCKYDAKSGIPDASRKGEELVRQSLARLEESRELIPYAKASAELRKWKAAQEGNVESAKQNWCPAKVKRGSADLYYASTNEEGVSEFLFCDGSKVTRGEDGKPTYVGPDTKKVPTKPYLDAVASYPEKEIQAAPRLPKKAAAPEGEAGSGE